MTQNLNQVQVPYNLEAEQSVLGALMLDATGKQADLVLNLLKPESFYLAVHQRIFAEIQYLAKANQPIDLLMLNTRLEAKGLSEQVGGLAYLAEIANQTVYVGNLLAYANLVRDEAIRRFTLGKIQECQGLLLSQNGLDAQSRLDSISRLMNEVADYSRSGKSSGLRTGKEVAQDWTNAWSERFHSPESVKGLSTGIASFDELLGSRKLLRQSLVVIGARPKVGKTALFTTIAANCVVNEKKPALLFSLEMPSQAIFERMFTQLANISPRVFYDDENQLANMGISVEADRNRGMQAISDLVANDLLFIDDTPAITIAHIRNECRRIKRSQGQIGLIAVDYLTLMKADNAERNDLAYGQITKELKALAREMDCVVLLLSQLNRSLENRADKRPQPSDGRDTRQIEQDCDYWIGLYRESVYQESADKNLTEILLRLNRHGETGKVYVEQRNGAIFDIDQIDGARRAEAGKPQATQKKYAKGGF